MANDDPPEPEKELLALPSNLPLFVRVVVSETHSTFPKVTANVALDNTNNTKKTKTFIYLNFRLLNIDNSI